MTVRTATANILLVDDDPTVLEILSESLSRKGYRVSTASSGTQALNAADTCSPELVILDAKLPDMHGLQVMHQLREDHNDVPVLFLSADGSVDLRLQALDSGAQDYLVKPVSLKELNYKIDTVLRRTSEDRQRRATHATLKTQVSKNRQHYDRVKRELQRQLLTMRTLFSVSQDLNRVPDHRELASVVSLTLVGELQISSMAMFSIERENAPNLRLLGVKGFEKEKFMGIEIDRRSPFVKALQRDAEPRKIARNPDRRWTKLLPDLRLAVFEYVTPITIKQEIKGLIFTGPKITGEDYDDYDLDMMKFIANSAGVGMENARLLKELQTTYVSTLKKMISVIEAKDLYTKGHTERVASYAVSIANRLELNEEHMRRILFGALLHDIGKLGVVDSIIHKEGKLDARERKTLKSHPVIGAEIVEK
ncbi:MAG: response regulator, partial [Candidatus Krumholzibacteriota bacterium]|nr:response regulator [Candidatus Krumholzibacteriota bacterium]